MSAGIICTIIASLLQRFLDQVISNIMSPRTRYYISENPSVISEGSE